MKYSTITNTDFKLFFLVLLVFLSATTAAAFLGFVLRLFLSGRLASVVAARTIAASTSLAVRRR